ncbi:MAG: ABC transporter substrate-binding protein [Acidobacteria bacterium]|nr:ABC transporter substrate-binding protein [Acidobacteriota bacterium]
MRISRREALATVGAGLGAAVAAPAFPAILQSRPLRIGALISQRDAQGQDELIQPYDRQMRLGLELAVAELNAGGGILGRQVELLVADDEGSPAPGAREALRLIRDEGAEAMVGGVVMAMPPYLDRALEREGLDVPVLHAAQTPGTYCGRVAHFGSTTLQAIATLVEHRGPAARRRTFQVSDWSPSQRTVSNQFYRRVQGGATGAALVTTPIRGNHPGEYTSLVRWARDLEAENFWISIPRPYAVNVVTQAHALGVASEFAYHFLEFSEWQASRLPDGVEAWTSVPFVASEDRAGVREFVARARRHAGDDLVTHVAFSHHTAIRALARAMEVAGTTAAGPVRAALDGLRLEVATGELALGSGGYATMPMYVSRATRGGLEVAQRFEAAAPGATCA